MAKIKNYLIHIKGIDPNTFKTWDIKEMECTSATKLLNVILPELSEEFGTISVTLPKPTYDWQDYQHIFVWLERKAD